jgi:diaminopimelate epimerase
MDERHHHKVVLGTRAGMLSCTDAGKGLVTANMGAPGLLWQDIPLALEVDTNNFTLPLEGMPVPVAAVSMGNPHCILFVANAEQAPVAQLGPLIEIHPMVPQKVNVEFVQVLSPERIRMRVWERGAGITLACGTGACAVAVAAARRGLTNRKVEVILDGGSLFLDWRESDGHVLMTGPAATSFTGEVDLDGL